MEILIVSMFPLEGSGSGTYCINIAKDYLEAGNKVHLIVPSSSAKADIDGADIVTVNACGEKPFPVFTAHPESTRTFDAMTDIELEEYVQAYDRAIREIIEKYEIGLIHFQHIWCIAALAEKYNVPSLVTCHGTDILGFEKWPRFRSAFFRAFEGCTEIIAVSESQAEKLSGLRPEFRDKIRIKYNSYDSSVFRIRELDRRTVLRDLGCDRTPSRILLFAGKLTKMKGIDILLEAYLDMKSYLELDVEMPMLIIAGSGNLDDYAKAFCRRNKLRDVIFTGHISQSLLCEIMNISDALIMPSRYEPFGYSAVEAMACGLFVVGSRLDGLKEIVSEENGLLFEAGDIQALAKIMAEIAAAQQKCSCERKRLAEYAYSHFSSRCFNEKTQNLV